MLRLLKALRHEAPDVAATAKRLGVKGSDPIAYVLKTLNTAHAGKMSVVARAGRPDRRRRHAALAGAGGRPRVRHVQAARPGTEKRGAAAAGETVALGKLEYANTGDTLSAGKQAHPALLEGRAACAGAGDRGLAKERKDDVKLGQALHKLLEEDPSIPLVHNAEPHEVVVWGQGEMHLRVATERLAERFGVAITPAGRRSATTRPSRRRSSCAAATRSNPAAMASSATWCSTSSRCRGARGFKFEDKITAAWCRATTFPRSRRAPSMPSSTGRSASRSWTCRRAGRRLLSHR